MGRVTAAPHTAPTREAPSSVQPEIFEESEFARPWVTIVHNDPVNLMSYVTWVFQQLFGYPKDKAELLMLDVHRKGRAVVSAGARERMEYDAARLHSYGLWATVDKQ